MPVSFYEVVWIFLIYAFLGWCTEVSYAALNTGKFVNRGFLNGPVCPVYGCGVLLVVLVLTPLKENLLILFVGSVILTTAIEFVTGFLLEKLFHNHWWDYSNQPFNVCGYICLKFSILWGLACTFVMDIVHPLIYKLIRIVPHMVGLIILIVLMAAFCCDLGVTVATVLKLNKRLKMLEEAAGKLHAISDGIGENIYENVTIALEKSEEFKENHKEVLDKLNEKKDFLVAKKEEKQREYEELTQKYKELLEKKTFGFKRLLKAFPDMVSRDQNESLQKYKEHFNIRRKQEKKQKEK